MSFSVVPCEVVGAASDFWSCILSGSGQHTLLESEITVVVCPLPPADHARSTLSHLSHTGCAAPAAPSCRVLGRDSDQVSGHQPEHLAVASARQVCSQGSKRNSVWCLVAVPSFFFFIFLPTPEVTGVAGGAHWQAPVLASLISLWPLRCLLRFVPATYRSCKRHHVTLSPLMPLAHIRGVWLLVTCTSAQSPLK